jgi:hypothetical protein
MIRTCAQRRALADLQWTERVMGPDDQAAALRIASDAIVYEAAVCDGEVHIVAGDYRAMASRMQLEEIWSVQHASPDRRGLQHPGAGTGQR